jgi:hypothetical protein
LKIKHIVTENAEIKAAMVERFIRTLRERLGRYFTHNNTFKYVNVLEKVISSYNSSVHTATNVAPNKVSTRNTKKVWDYLYSGKGRYPRLEIFAKAKFSVGDKIRISKVKARFSKVDDPNWSQEVFYIAKVLNYDPPRYKVRDSEGEILQGDFYEAEIQRVTEESNKAYKIQHIVATRKKGASRELLVKWVGYPAKFNSWIAEKDLLNV